MNKTFLNFSVIIVILTMFLMGCGKSKKIDLPKNEEFVTDVVLDSFFKTLYENGMFNGAVAVKKKGELILKKGYGTANFDMNTPFLSQTAMEIASVSKQFTALAILLLEQEGKLHLEDTLQNFFGDDFPYLNVSVQHLISHTSGLPDYEDYFQKNWDTTKIAYNKNIVNYLKKSKPKIINEPGKKYHYSNTGYILLAEIVQEVSGKELNIFLKENVFDVANMSETSFYDRDDIWTLKDYAPGYQIDPLTCQYERPENLFGKYYYYFLSGRLGSGRLSSSVDDLIKWDRILYSDSLLSDKGKKLAFKAYPAEDDASDYGFGWHVVENDSIGKVVFHTGSWAGNLAYIKRYLTDKSLVIILNNTYSPYMKQIRMAVDAYLMGKPLVIPERIGVELLRKEICNLDKSIVLDWYNLHSDTDWNIKDLKTLSQQYQLIGDDKAALVEILINEISFNNK